MEVTVEIRYALVEARSEKKLKKKVERKRRDGYIASGPVTRTRVGRRIFYSQTMVKYPNLPE